MATTTNKLYSSEKSLEIQLVQQPHPKEVTIRWYHWAILISIDMIGPFSQDAYIPNMPQMQEDLDMIRFGMMLTLQANWVVKAFTQLSIGWISDRLGRKPTLFFTLCLYMMGTFVCSVCTEGWQLIAARAIQAMGEGNAVICLAIARDANDNETERLRLITILQMFRPIAIFMGPTVGGTFGTLFGWRWLFRMLTCWGFINFLGVFCLPETRSKRDKYRNFFKNMATLYCDIWFVGLSLTCSVLYSVIFSFISTFPYLLEDYYGKSALFSGIMMGVIPCSGIVAAMISNRLAKRGVSSMLMLRCGFVIICIVAAGLALDALYFAQRGWYMLVFPLMGLVGMCFFLCIPMMNMILQPFKQIAGQCSGVASFSRTIVATGVSFITNEIFDYKPPSVLWTLVGIVSTATIIFLSTIGFRTYDPNYAVFSDDEEDDPVDMQEEVQSIMSFQSHTL